MSVSAMKQALKALESIKVTVSTSIQANVVDGIDLFPKEIVALRQAIAEAEKQEAVAWMWKDGTLTSDPDFADGTWTPLFAAPVHASDISQEPVDETAKDRHEDIYDIWVEQELKEKNVPQP